MRTLLLSLAVAALTGPALPAGDDKDEKAKPSLKVGDPAPPLKANKWLNGPELKSFAPGKIYVVEVWATWCGPCIVMMPHLGDIQEELGPKGVTVIGFTAKDANNDQEKVVKFVDKRGGKLGYTIAYADDRETHDAFMKASGQGGIPCSFVVGKDGKIAYIGHPLFLDEVLEKVLAGTWDPVKGTEEMEAANKEWDATFEAITEMPDPKKPNAEKPDPKKQLAKWEEFAAKWPRLAADPYMTTARLNLLVKAERFADARKLAETMTTKAVKRNDMAGLSNVCEAMAAEGGDADLAKIGVRAAEAALAIDGETVATLTRVTKACAAAGDKAKVGQYGPKAVAAAEKALTGDKDVQGTLRLAAAHAAVGDKEKAKAAAEKAVGMVDEKNVRMKRFVEEQAKKYGAEPKKDDKKDG
jgi:thiol-disulfide isomerase/thioredoxin